MKNKILTTILIISSGIFLLSVLEGWMVKPTVIDNAVIEKSAAKGLLLLQKSGYIFINNTKSKCASCHHNTLTSMASEIARQKGLAVIDSLASANTKAMERDIVVVCNPNQIDRFLTISFAVPYLLLGLNAENYPANMYTDITVDYMMNQAKPDGSFLAESGRVPLETGDIHLTAMAIRSIELYASPAKKKRVDELVAKTRQWLENTQTDQQQELAFQLLGLEWSGSTISYKTMMLTNSKPCKMQKEAGPSCPL